MAEVAALRLARRDRHFTFVLFSAGAILLAFISMLENDRRGLLRWERPGAFAAGDVTPLPDSYDIVYLGLGQPQGANNPERGRAARLIPRREGTSGLGTPGGAGAASPAAVPLASTNPGLAQGPAGDPSPANGFTPGQAGPTPFAPSTFGGGGGSPPGVIVVQNPPVVPPVPTVPAVPEPTAWLLMILGVGILATALRRRAVTDKGAVGRYPLGLAGQAG